jgi:hypothetical protein
MACSPGVGAEQPAVHTFTMEVVATVEHPQLIIHAKDLETDRTGILRFVRIVIFLIDRGGDLI